MLGLCENLKIIIFGWKKYTGSRERHWQRIDQLGVVWPRNLFYPKPSRFNRPPSATPRRRLLSRPPLLALRFSLSRHLWGRAVLLQGKAGPVIAPAPGLIAGSSAATSDIERRVLPGALDYGSSNVGPSLDILIDDLPRTQVRPN